MRIIYFQPRLSAGKNYRNGTGAEQVWAPWWAMMLQQYVPPGTDARLIDARCRDDWLPALRAELTDETLLAVSVMTGHAIHDAIEASQAARSAGAQVVWGGPHPTLFPDQTLAEDYVDHVVTGFGSRTFGRLVTAMDAGETVPGTLDSIGAKGPMLVTLSRRPTAAEQFTPDLSLITDWEPYINPDQALGDRAANLITSEGCLRRCTYCSEPKTSGHSWLAYDVEQCTETAVQMLQLAEASSLKLHDPNFLHDLPRGLQFARSLRARRYIPWAATLHPRDLLDATDDDIAALADSGLSRVLVGLESPVQELVNLAGKKYDVDRIPELARKLARHSIAGMFTFIVGWPGADDTHYRRTIDCAFMLKGAHPEHQAKIHFLEPWPGTPIHKLLSRKSPLPMRTTKEWGDIDYYFAHLPQLHDAEWETEIRQANEELSPYVEA
ncbi:B12-binding domain-containing radical SAM protein [Streptomyces sp. NPDC102381]|uniref:B12-binding domain-containing radical SAM protein n=1 Tax=Streptomyces sp. NPDC102381 TaxID=3366164 RepID=UPI0038292E7B